MKREGLNVSQHETPLWFFIRFKLLVIYLVRLRDDAEASLELNAYSLYLVVPLYPFNWFLFIADV